MPVDLLDPRCARQSFCTKAEDGSPLFGRSLYVTEGGLRYV